MSKFEKFAEFVMANAIYPLVLTFITAIIPVAVYFSTGVELMWMVNSCGILSCITAVWLALFMVAFTGTRIIDWLDERRWKAEHPED